MNAHGPIQWVQDERGEMHYGVQDRMSASSRDEKEEKHVLKYVGDPVFGFKPSKTRIEVCKTLCRDVRMEATECHNAVILFGSSRVSTGLRENVRGNSLLAFHGQRRSKESQATTEKETKSRFFQYYDDQTIHLKIC